MKILALVTESYGGFGGVAVYNIDMMNALAELPFTKNITILPRLIREDPQNVPAKCEIDTRGIGGLMAYFSASLKHAIKGDYDLILCTHMHLLPFAKIAAGMTGKPVACVLYGTEAWVPTGRRMTDYLVKRCDSIISISDFTAERFSQWANISEDTIKLLPNAFHGGDFGIKPKSQALLERYNIGTRKVIMTLGRLDARERQKGFDELIDALPSMLKEDPNLVYLICGDGDDRARLEEKVASKGLERDVVFAGRISEKEKADHYRLANVFSMVGRQEGFGFVFLEALACGTPVIGSQLDGSRYALLHGKLGRLANPDKPESIKQAIFEALEEPRHIPEEMDYFSYSNFVERLQAIIAPYANIAKHNTNK